jgi:hypothetical protein
MRIKKGARFKRYRVALVFQKPMIMKRIRGKERRIKSLFAGLRSRKIIPA